MGLVARLIRIGLAAEPLFVFLLAALPVVVEPSPPISADVSEGNKQLTSKGIGSADDGFELRHVVYDETAALDSSIFSRSLRRNLSSSSALHGRRVRPGRSRLRFRQDSSRRLQDVASAEAEALPVYDFTYEGENIVEAEEEVVAGNLSIYGVFEPEQILLIVDTARAVLLEICGCDPEATEDDDAEECLENPARVYVRVVQDIATFGQRRIGLNLEYWVLTELGGGSTLCADALAIAGYGNPEPPFDVIPEPAYRLMFAQQVRNNKDLFSLNLDDFLIELTLPICEMAQVVMREDQPVMPEQKFKDERLDQRECGAFEEGDGGAGDMLAKAKSGGVWESPGLLCKFAKSPCMCAALKTCTWKQNTAGVLMCMKGGGGYVDCDFCPWPYQEDCPSDNAALCALNMQPCTCTKSVMGCVWSEKSQSCVIKVGEERTPCTSCAQQWHCNPPEITNINPGMGSSLPRGDEYYINVTFDRLMSFKTVGTRHVIAYGAVTFLCRRPPPSPPAIFDIRGYRLFWITRGFDPRHRKGRDRVDHPNFSWSADEGDVLQIHVNGTPNKYPTDCDLIIAPEALEDEGTRIPYLGMRLGEHTFAMTDTWGPELAEYSPKNSVGNVGVDAEITFFFDEEIRLGNNLGVKPEAVLVELGGSSDADTQNTSAIEAVSSDRVVGSIQLDGPNARISGNALTILLDGFAAHSTRYTIGIGKGCLEDKNDNEFLGLPVGNYIFNTGPPTFTAKPVVVEEDVEGQPMFIYFAIFIAIILWFGCLAFCFLMFKVHQQRRRLITQIEQDPVKATGSLPDRSWDGTYIHGYKMEKEGIDFGLGDAEDNSQGFPVSPKSTSSGFHKQGTAPLPAPGLSMSPRAGAMMSPRSNMPTMSPPPGLPGSPLSSPKRSKAPWRIKDPETSLRTLSGDSRPLSSTSPSSRRGVTSPANASRTGGGSPQSPSRSHAWSPQSSPTISRSWQPGANGTPTSVKGLKQAAAADAAGEGARLVPEATASPKALTLPGGVINSRSPSPAARKD